LDQAVAFQLTLPGYSFIHTYTSVGRGRGIALFGV